MKLVKGFLRNSTTTERLSNIAVLAIERVRAEKMDLDDLVAVACRGLVIPVATAWLDAPLPNSSIEQWRMVVIVTGYTLFVTS